MYSPLCFITAVQRMGKSCIPVRTPSMLMRLITRVTSLDTSSMLLKRFPRSVFFLNFWNKSKSGGLMSALYSGWGSTCHPYFSKISDIAPQAWGRALSCLTPVSFFFHFKAPFCRTRTTYPAISHTVFFTEVWLTTVAKIRTIASSYRPGKRSVQNFWNDLRIQELTLKTNIR
jgi:hypothetical protein